MSTQRMYMLSTNSYPSNISTIFANHRTHHHEAIHFNSLFNNLRAVTATNARGISPTQYAIYCSNYLKRTRNTIPSISKALAAASKNKDYITLAGIGKNLYEETGEGNDLNSHARLLQDAHLSHGQNVFKLPVEILSPPYEFELSSTTPPSLSPSLSSTNLLTPELDSFLRIQNSLYESPNYLEVIGVSYAQELAAGPMLTAFQTTLFNPYSTYYHQQSDWLSVRKYFDVHLETGVEDQHAAVAQEAVKRNCKSVEELQIALGAADLFLEAQTTLWNAIWKKMEECKDQPIPPHRE